MYIEKVSEVTAELEDTLKRLVPQLSDHRDPPTIDDLTKLVNSEASTLLIAREPDEQSPIVGVLCLSIYRVPTGLRSIIEDVVVDQSVRRRGIGEALVRCAIDLAREAGAEGVALTSNPRRAAANRLYQSLGFELRNTNAYSYKLK
jgi:ribosomal protein S18 acetylase RimI-like enzyme